MIREDLYISLNTNMNTPKAFWDKKLHSYASQDFVNIPSIFLLEVLKYIKKNSKVLELGAGHGQDSVYLAKEGHTVIATDFSDTAVEYLEKKKAENNLDDELQIRKLDTMEIGSLNGQKFDVVYSHVSLHYFTLEDTKNILTTIHSLLNDNGLLIFIANSTDDPEYMQGTMLEEDYFELEPGDVKRFFSVETVTKLTAELFEIELLDNKGTTIKDKKKGVNNLIRFVGRKKA